MPKWKNVGGSFLGRLSRSNSGYSSANRDRPVPIQLPPDADADAACTTSEHSPSIQLADSTMVNEEEGLKSAKELVEEAWKMKRGVEGAGVQGGTALRDLPLEAFNREEREYALQALSQVLSSALSKATLQDAKNPNPTPRSTPQGRSALPQRDVSSSSHVNGTPRLPRNSEVDAAESDRVDAGHALRLEANDYLLARTALGLITKAEPTPIPIPSPSASPRGGMVGMAPLAGVLDDVPSAMQLARRPLKDWADDTEQDVVHRMPLEGFKEAIQMDESLGMPRSPQGSRGGTGLGMTARLRSEELDLDDTEDESCSWCCALVTRRWRGTSQHDGSPDKGGQSSPRLTSGALQSLYKFPGRMPDEPDYTPVQPAVSITPTTTPTRSYIDIDSFALSPTPVTEPAPRTPAIVPKLSFDLMRSPDSSERPVAAASTPNFPAAHANSAANVISVVLAAASNAICNESIPGAITPRGWGGSEAGDVRPYPEGEADEAAQVAADWLWALRAVISNSTQPSSSSPAHTTSYSTSSRGGSHSPSSPAQSPATCASALMPEYGDLALLTYLGRVAMRLPLMRGGVGGLTLLLEAMVEVLWPKLDAIRYVNLKYEELKALQVLVQHLSDFTAHVVRNWLNRPVAASRPRVFLATTRLFCLITTSSSSLIPAATKPLNLLLHLAAESRYKMLISRIRQTPGAKNMLPLPRLCQSLMADMRHAREFEKAFKPESIGLAQATRQVYGAQLSQELPGGLHRPMHVHEGLFDLLESSLHIIVENLASGLEKTSTVHYMQKLFQQSYDTWLEGWRLRLTAQSCKVNEESWEPSDKPWRVSRTMVGLRDTYKDFITEALPHIGTLPHFRQLLEKMLAGIGATHAAKLQAICQHNLTASGKEFSAPIGAAALVSMVRRDHAARKMAEMQRLYNNRFKRAHVPLNDLWEIAVLHTLAFDTLHAQWSDFVPADSATPLSTAEHDPVLSACRRSLDVCVEQLARSVAVKLEDVLTVTLFERLAQCPDNPESIVAEASAIVEVITVLIEPDSDTFKGTLRPEVSQAVWFAVWGKIGDYLDQALQMLLRAQEQYNEGIDGIGLTVLAFNSITRGVGFLLRSDLLAQLHKGDEPPSVKALQAVLREYGSVA